MTDLPNPGNPEPDIDELLHPVAPHADGGLRERLAERTARRVRLRRWTNWATLIVGLATAFGAGVGFRDWLGDRSAPVLPPFVIQAPSRHDEPPRPVSPAEMERRAEAIMDAKESALLFREAGDRYLTEWDDVRSALRCYRAFLDQADPADLAAARTDTWLLTSLKESRQKEDDRADTN